MDVNLEKGFNTGILFRAIVDSPILLKAQKRGSFLSKAGYFKAVNCKKVEGSRNLESQAIKKVARCLEKPSWKNPPVFKELFHDPLRISKESSLDNAYWKIQGGLFYRCLYALRYLQVTKVEKRVCVNRRENLGERI